MKLSKFCNKISLILQALWCAVLYFLIEALCRHSVVEAWDYMTGKPLVFAYNTMFIFTTMLIVYLFHRRCFWRVVVSVFWLFLGIVNCILLMNRVTPFTGPDLHMLTDGIAIMQKYLPFYGVVIGCILIGIVVLGLLILLVKGPKYEQKIKYRYVIPLVIVWRLLFLIQASVSRGIILRMRLTGSRRQSPIFQRPRRMERDRIFCSFSLSLSLTQHW